jgi:hypothetical protein
MNPALSFIIKAVSSRRVSNPQFVLIGVLYAMSKVLGKGVAQLWDRQAVPLLQFAEDAR